MNLKLVKQYKNQQNPKLAIEKINKISKLLARAEGGREEETQ